MADIQSTIRLIGDATSVIQMYNQLARADKEYRAQVSRAITETVNAQFAGARGAQGLAPIAFDNRSAKQYASRWVTEMKNGIRQIREELGEGFDIGPGYKLGKGGRALTPVIRDPKTGRVEIVPGSKRSFTDEAGNVVREERSFQRGRPITSGLPYIGKQIEQYDTLNRTIKTTTDLYIRAADGTEEYHSTIKSYLGDLDKVEAAEQAIAQAKQTNIESNKIYGDSVRRVRKEYEDLFNTIVGPKKAAWQKAEQDITNKQDFNAAQRAVRAQQSRITSLQQIPEAQSALARVQNAPTVGRGFINSFDNLNDPVLSQAVSRGKKFVEAITGNMFGPGQEVILGRYVGGKLAGIMKLAVDASGKALGQHVAVKPGYERKGIATSLYDEAQRRGYNVLGSIGSTGLSDQGRAFAEKYLNQKLQASLGYQAGNFGYGRDTTLERMTQGRGTGHFGTGSYFVSDPSKITGRGNRPIDFADVSSFNLLKPVSEAQGFALHDLLKEINDATYVKKNLEDAKKRLSEITGKSLKEVRAAVSQGLTGARADVGKPGYRETASTRTLRNLGYQGVDVRHLPALDNTQYGSVVFGREGLQGERAKLKDLETVLGQKRSILGKDIAGIKALTERARVAYRDYANAGHDPLLSKAKDAVSNLTKRFTGGPLDTQINANAQRLEEARAARQAALSSRPPVPQIFQQIPQKPLNKLLQLLPPGALNNPEIAEHLSLQRDLIHGVTQVNGAFKDQAGVLNSVSLSYDKNGTVITKFGGHLSGLQNALKQTVANMTKVVYWTTATTAVLGTLGLIGSTISNLTELDKILNRLSVTAQLTQQQTNVLFQGLADVAYQTATPLNELVSAADDIALATRKAGQSTEEWQSQILSLGKSVGILTNLTGLDTVKATDLLTSTMKQLGIDTSDLITILNKVTAVGGGQSVAISDIVEGLGQMAEAAQTSGLSLDETIATVQVLSQVTSKSSKEVATAFKNLTGSLGGKAAKDALDALQIPLKDNQGNLRNIIDIYRDVAKALQDGRLAASDLQATLRALAGGPRRLPDAAALLSAIPQIDEVSKKAASATNEALLANQKVLDTLQAKIVQLQVTFERVAFSKFGKGLKEAGTVIIDILTKILKVLEQIPSGFYASIIQIGAFVAASKLMTTTIRYGVGLLLDMAEGMVNVGRSAIGAAEGVGAFAAATTAANAVAARTPLGINGQPLVGTSGLPLVVNPAQAPVPPTSKLGRIGAGITRFGAGNALAIGAGAALGAATGGPAEALQGAGLTALLAVPIPQVKLLGAALLGVGTAIKFFSGEAKEAAPNVADLHEAILESISGYEDASAAISSLTEQRRGLIEQASKQQKQIQGTKDITDRNSAQAVYNATLTQYGDVTKQLADANSQLTNSFNTLDAALAKSGDSFKTQVNLAKAGALDLKQLGDLAEEVATKIFSEQNPDFPLKPGANGKLPRPVEATPLPFYGPGPASASVEVLPPGIEKGTQSYQDYIKLVGGAVAITENLTAATLQSDKVLKLFDETGTKIVGTFSQTAATVDVIRGQLTAMAADGNEVAKSALATFNAYVGVSDALTNTQLFAGFQKQLVEAKQLIGSIGADEAENIKKNIDLYTRLIESAAQLPTALGAPPDERGNPANNDFAGTQQGRQREIQKAFLDAKGDITGQVFDIDTARKFVDYLGIAQGLKQAGIELDDKSVAILAAQNGIQTNISIELEKQKTATEELTKIQEDLSAQRDSNLDDLAKKNQEITKQFLEGDITAKQRDALLAGASATKELNDQLVSMFSNISGNDEILGQLEGRLSKIPGLENLTGKNAADASSLLLGFLSTLDLNSKGAEILTKKVLALIAGLDAVPAITEAEIHLEITKSVGKSVNDDPRFIYAIQHGNERLAEQIKQEYEKAASAAVKAGAKNNTQALKDIINLINGIVSGKLPGYTNISSGGSSSKKAKEAKQATPPDVSTVDLPDEIANAANRDALIKEAVKRAKELQAKIPGAKKEASNDIVELLKGTQRILEVRGVKDDLLRRALDELAEIEKKRLEFETKADIIRRIRVGGGDFASIANVPLNSKTGVSLGGQNDINITLNVNGQVSTPAQLAQLAEQIAAALKRQIGSSG